MKTFNEMNTVELLDSFNSGQGKTSDIGGGVALSDIASLVNDKLAYAGNSVQVTQDWERAYLLLQLHKELKDKSASAQTNLMNAFAEGRLSLNHRLETAEKIAKPLTGHYLTAENLQNNYLSLAANKTTIENIYSLVSDIGDSSKRTKADLEKVLYAIKEAIISEDQFEALHILIEKEESAQMALGALDKLGLSDCKLISESRITGSAELVDVAGIVEALPSIGYKKVDAVFNAETMTITVTVDKID